MLEFHVAIVFVIAWTCDVGNAYAICYILWRRSRCLSAQNYHFKLRTNKKLRYCWETERRESMPRIAWNKRGNDNLGWNHLQMYFKVIKSRTNRMYDFLLVVYSNFCRITHRFWEIRCETVQWPWNMPKVIDSCITWKLSCGHVCKSEESKRLKRKSPFSTTPVSFDSPVNPREYLHKPYIARNYVPWATFLSLTVYG